MATIVKKVASLVQVQAIQGVELNWFTNKNDTWCANTDLGWCVASGKLEPEQVAQAIEDGDISYAVDETTGLTTYFVGYNTTRRTFVQTIKQFSAKKSEPMTQHIAKVSGIYRELE